MALLAGSSLASSVELDDVLGAGSLMEVVDILSYDSLEEAPFLKVGEDLVSHIWLNVVVLHEVDEAGLDSPPALGGIAHEVTNLDVVGVVLAPESVFAASEGRDSAFEGDACAGEGDGVASVENLAGSLFDFLIK